jgi:hypothetical protein
MASAPKGKMPARAEEEGLDDELLKRLAGLSS